MGRPAGRSFAVPMFKHDIRYIAARPRWLSETLEGTEMTKSADLIDGLVLTFEFAADGGPGIDRARLESSTSSATD